MTCNQTEERLSSYLDLELGAPERTEIEAHLASCLECQRSLEALRAQSRELEAAFAPLRSGSEALARRIISTLHAEPSGRERLRRAPLLAALAAGFLLAAGLFAVWPSRQAPRTVAESPEQVKDLQAQVDREHQTCLELEKKLAGAASLAESMRKEQAHRSDLEEKLARVQKADLELRTELERRLAQSETRIQSLARELAQKGAEAPQPTQPAAAPIATLVSAIGTVELQVGADWRPLLPGESLASGACVRTPPESKASFSCPDGTEVRLNAATEAQWTEPRVLMLKEGEIFARPAAAKTPFLLRTSQGTFETGPGAFDLALRPDRIPQKFQKTPPRTIASLAVLEGTARLGQGKSEEVIPASTACDLSESAIPSYRSVDWVLHSRWIHELLKIGTDDLEIDRRVTAMLVQMGQTKTPEVYELEIRALGERSARALFRAIASPTADMDAYHRREASRLLGDLAGAAWVPDLVELLQDPDREVVKAAEKGLERLSGQKQKSPEDWTRWLRDTRALWGRPLEAQKKSLLK